MPELLKAVEAVPAAWPATPSGLSTAAAALAPAVVWGRIEAWVSVRWSVRSAVWTVEGEGEFVPPLSPWTVTGSQVWEGGAWVAVTLPVGPLGLELVGDGPYRITADVGAGPVPAAAEEAYRRLAEYLASPVAGVAGVARHEIDLGGVRESIERNPAWVARAIHYSGAADLLRPYRGAR